MYDSTAVGRKLTAKTASSALSAVVFRNVDGTHVFGMNGRRAWQLARAIAVNPSDIAALDAFRATQAATTIAAPNNVPQNQTRPSRHPSRQFSVCRQLRPRVTALVDLNAHCPGAQPSGSASSQSRCPSQATAARAIRDGDGGTISRPRRTEFQRVDR